MYSTQFSSSRSRAGHSGPQGGGGFRDICELASKRSTTSGSLEHSPFDLCPTPLVKINKLNRSLVDKVREMFWRDDARLDTGLVQLRLRPGMVLLKKFLSQNDQIAIIKLCRDLGVGAGGFYQPSRRDAELGLQMMSLGKSWNSEVNKYEERCSIDGAEPPLIPDLFKKLVKKAMQGSHDLIKQMIEGHAEDELPELSPDICIVDYYSITGRPCLRQDKYESKDSICKALPVVTFSIGDSVDFLSGDHEDEDAAKNIMLESGDVLVYGGRSRFIYHRVSKIYRDYSPKRLIEETNLRPGHLSLTFKQY